MDLNAAQVTVMESHEVDGTSWFQRYGNHIIFLRETFPIPRKEKKEIVCYFILM